METEQEKQSENMKTEQEKGRESLQEAWEEENAFSGLPWPRWLRRGAVLGGVLLILAGGTGIWNGVRRQQETQETVLTDYEVRTEGIARVHLIPNSLYETEWLEAGQVCAVNLTDYVELTFSAAAKGMGTEHSVCTGHGQVSAILTGYQMSGDNRKTVYEQREVMKEQKTADASLQPGQKTMDGAEQPGMGVLDMTLQIRPSDYLERAEAADRILGGSVSRSLSLLFEGSFTVEAGGQTADEPFSCQVEIPLAAQGSFFEISLPEPDIRQGKITEQEAVKLPVRGKQIAIGAAGIPAGAVLIWFVLWMTREPDAQENWERRMRVLLKRYGSQLFEVEQLPEVTGKSRICLCSLDSLIQISEDLRCPVLYVQGENGLPDQGRFLVSGETVCYEAVLRLETAPLVEDEGPEGGT